MSDVLEPQLDRAQRGGHAAARVVHERGRLEQEHGAAADHAFGDAAVEPALRARHAVAARQLLDHAVADVVRRALVRRPGVAQADDEALDAR